MGKGQCLGLMDWIVVGDGKIDDGYSDGPVAYRPGVWRGPQPKASTSTAKPTPLGGVQEWDLIRSSSTKMVE